MFCSNVYGKNLTGPQKNAVNSANQYLPVSGFTRQGLTNHLSSDFGNGYSISDATIAVDSLNIDWKKQSVKSANLYITMQGFSCKGLIEQLPSEFGSGYTLEEATYGAHQTSACE